MLVLTSVFPELTYAQVFGFGFLHIRGNKGHYQGGGTARRAVADKLLKSLGGRLEAFYFALGENAAYVIFDVPRQLDCGRYLAGRS